ncbi:MAG: carbonic anhydrase [Planctomycetia bacterium]|nr:carbonic anhydrase [Planctomycetia bacterium]
MKRIVPLAVVFCLAAAVVCHRLPAEEPSAASPTRPGQMTADMALRLLKEGNARFVANNLREAKLDSKQRVDMAQSQRPIAVVLTCSDSRAAPELVFDKGLGVLFVVRVAGNVSGPEVLASIEYALAELKVPLVVVLGHSNCGAVGAAIKGKQQPSPNLQHLVDLIHTGGDLPEDRAAALEVAVQNNVNFQTGLLTKNSQIIDEFTKHGGVKIVPAMYDLKSGHVEWIEQPKQ